MTCIGPKWTEKKKGSELVVPVTVSEKTVTPRMMRKRVSAVDQRYQRQNDRSAKPGEGIVAEMGEKHYPERYRGKTKDVWTTDPAQDPKRGDKTSCIGSTV